MRAVIMAAALVSGLAAAATAKPIEYELPEETAELAPGPGQDLAQANCAACHSADYISTQPRNQRDPRAFWTAEVTKMRHVYGAPIEESDVKAIVDYLVAAYGK
ncbi:MAG TPA: cytochrome c [Roseomonas sp.]|nr:cytochrome c [Roseomonas sp.]